MKGFTLIELMFSIAIVAILSTIVVGSFRTAQTKKEEQGIVQTLLADLDKQKSDTQAGKSGLNYGVKFNDTNYELFNGTTYSLNSVDKTITLNPKFKLSETIVNAQNIIYFSKINGAANENATITVSHISNLVPPLILTIEKSGSISVIE